MNRAEMLEEGRMLRQQDRGSAFDYYEQQRQRAAISHDRDLWLASTLTLAWELLESGQQDRGLIDQVATVAEPNDPFLLLAQGQKLLTEGKILDAIVTLQTPTTTDDLELQGLLSDHLGLCYSLSHQFDSATKHYDRAITLFSPDSFYLGFSHVHLGEMFLFMQNFDKGEEEAQTALEIALQTEDTLLRFNALVLLIKIALRRQQWEVANALIEDAQELIDPDIDHLEVATLLLLQIEQLIRTEDVSAALSLWDYVPASLAKVNKWQIHQQAKYIEGLLGIGKIAEGLINLNEDIVESLEDILLDVATAYEEQQMYSHQALVLLDITHLYSFAIKLPTPYEFQGKSIRSVEQAGVLLKQIGLQDTQLGQEIDQIYDRILDHLSYRQTFAE